MKKLAIKLCVSALLVAVLALPVAYAAALTAERLTPSRTGSSLYLDVAGSTTIYAGGMVAVNANGNATNAGDVANLKVVGRAESTVDNSSGTNGQLKITVAVGIFRWANEANVTDANIGDICYVVDDQTVSVTNSGSQSIIAGIVTDVDTDGVWVDSNRRQDAAVAATSLAVSGAATVGTTLGVTGVTTLSDNLNVSGTLTNAGNIIGAATTQGADLNATDDLTVGDDAAVSGILGVDETLIVGGAATFSNTISGTATYGSSAFGLSTTSYFALQNTTQLVYIASGVTNVIDSDLTN